MEPPRFLRTATEPENHARTRTSPRVRPNGEPIARVRRTAPARELCAGEFDRQRVHESCCARVVIESSVPPIHTSECLTLLKQQLERVSPAYATLQIATTHHCLDHRLSFLATQTFRESGHPTPCEILQGPGGSGWLLCLQRRDTRGGADCDEAHSYRELHQVATQVFGHGTRDEECWRPTSHCVAGYVQISTTTLNGCQFAPPS